VFGLASLVEIDERLDKDVGKWRGVVMKNVVLMLEIIIK